jgi:hypothetical protein
MAPNKLTMNGKKVPWPNGNHEWSRNDTIW